MHKFTLALSCLVLICTTSIYAEDVDPKPEENSHPKSSQNIKRIELKGGGIHLEETMDQIRYELMRRGREWKAINVSDIERSRH